MQTTHPAIRRYKLALNPTGTDLTAYVETGKARGRIVGIFIDKGTLADTTDITFSGETTGQAITTISNVLADVFLYPQTNVIEDNGSDTVDQFTPAIIWDERIKVVCGQVVSGNAGAVYVFIEGHDPWGEWDENEND